MTTLVRALAWLAVAAWMVAWGAALANPPRPIAARRWYLLGLLVHATHVVAAFQVVHGWDHAAAAVQTAEQAREAVGFAPSGAIWVNHAFAAVWLLGVLWPRRFGPAPWNETTWVARALHAFMAFIVVNGAVVFAHVGVLRLASTLALAWLLRRYVLAARGPIAQSKDAC